MSEPKKVTWSEFMAEFDESVRDRLLQPVPGKV